MAFSTFFGYWVWTKYNFFFRPTTFPIKISVSTVNSVKSNFCRYVVESKKSSNTWSFPFIYRTPRNSMLQEEGFTKECVQPFATSWSSSSFSRMNLLYPHHQMTMLNGKQIIGLANWGSVMWSRHHWKTWSRWVHFMNSEHQGSVNKVNMENLFCESCHYYRPQMKELKNRRILPGLSFHWFLKAKYISDLFFYHSTLGFLERGGIKPSSVVFMPFGVHVIPGKGVMENFTIFIGEDLIEKTKMDLKNDFFGFFLIPLNQQQRCIWLEC